MDAIDKKILNILQQDASLPIAEIAKRVGLSVTPCWRRVQRLDEIGVIRRRVALLDPQKIGANISVFVSVRTNEHNADWLKTFADTVASMPEVVEFYRMSGKLIICCVLWCQILNIMTRFIKQLISSVKLSDVSSSFAMEQIKFTTMLPITLKSSDKG